MEDEWKAVKDSKGSTRYISEPGVYLVKCTKVKFSEEDAAHEALVQQGKKRRYIEFELETGDGKKSRATFYRTLEKDKPETKELMNNKIKDFLTNCGADWTKNGQDIPRSCVGKSHNALFKSEEYIGYDKNANNKPERKTIVKYSFGKPADQQITGNQTYLVARLSDRDVQRFHLELENWTRENPQAANASTNTTTANPQDEMNKAIVDDDLPF